MRFTLDERRTTEHPVRGGPLLGVREQTPADALLAILAIDHQAANDDKGIRFHILGDHHVDPSDRSPAVVGNEELLVASGETGATSGSATALGSAW